jgi:hypothetical protein
MNQITVDKTELLAKLEQNRADHRRIFEEALKGFQRESLSELYAEIDRIRKGINRSVYVAKPIPKDHTRDYDRAIAMVNMAVGDTISLSERDFAQYVMDDWGWQKEFLNNTYGSTYAVEVHSDYFEDNN